MSGFKGEPSYDHYCDTDADNACDQLVDFSKRYPDDPEELCRPSPMKNQQLSLTSMNCGETKQLSDVNGHDEVKFFCTEGTPLMESSASSYWDLREVCGVQQNAGALISEEQTRIQHSFSSPPNFPISIPVTNHKNCMNSNLVVDEIHTFDQNEKRESINEDECINQETEASFTKSSSPLMFSRSSSVGSLNSFEQHSIVDDRSSVSAFSNLASGIISPSEIPDSPFEVASPFISKSNKSNEFVFPSSDKSADPVLVDQPIPNEDFTDEAFGDFVGNDLIKVYDDEGDCPSVSNLSALSIQADSTNVSISVIKGKNTLLSLTQESSVTLNCLVTDKEADFVEKYQNLEISDKNDIHEQNCINSIICQTSDVNQSEKTLSIIETKYEDKGTSTSEDFNLDFNSYEQGLPSFADAKESTPLKKGYRVNSFIQQYKDQLQSSDYSKDNSDDEFDDLLAECILSGMPSKDSSKLNDSKQPLNHSFQTSESSLKESFDVSNCSFSDNDVSDDDDDDGILNECVLLGKPQNSNSIQIQAGKSSEFEISSCSSVTNNKLPASNSPNHQLKLLDEILLQEKQIKQEPDNQHLNLFATESISNQKNFAKKEEFSTFNLISQSKDQLDYIRNDLVKSDDSDNDESDLLVQQIIQLGMPKNPLRSPKSQKEIKLPVTYPPNKDLGCRDNCPDGVSDGEDDDDVILKEIIEAGKPDSKSETNTLVCAESRPYLKAQNQKKLTAAEDRQLYLNKYYYGNTPKACASDNSLTEVEDCMRVWRTEDTPILSPTASISDLSTLSFTEDKICQESFRNNSRNSDCSSESEDDELMIQCIRKGMPAARQVAV